MVEINWTLEAELWLADIYSYIAVDDRIAAARTVTGNFLKKQLLKQHPQLGHKYEAEKVREIRILLYGHFRVAYLAISDSRIDILGVFHGALNIERYLV